MTSIDEAEIARIVSGLREFQAQCETALLAITTLVHDVQARIAIIDDLGRRVAVLEKDFRNDRYII